MTKLVRSALIPVWLVLVVATGISWYLGVDHGSGSPVTASTVILVVAFAKVTLIGLYFMELRHAPALLRWIFLGWSGVACAAVVGIYLAS
ncbi:hypothetical protein GPX89_26145 [Nocardia sp. ET3-3]|uniref:Cytochrome c oxidase subunit IV n=1 Tax=Nocardia terrae TaxID=2675851 RepID=A0A7K1V2F7_9NOCA|nr:cytochrome C oxidase subunit IV family protein [Nocardia terrae]MVU80721.1 hypothetical protein [Nocardia terrae]